MTSWLRRHRLDLIWFVWLLLFTVAETVGILSRRDGDTLSERTRAWFRTNTSRGRVTFTISWVLFAGWFLWHILSRNQ